MSNYEEKEEKNILHVNRNIMIMVERVNDSNESEKKSSERKI